MTLFDFVRHAPLLGFGIRAITSQIHPDSVRHDEIVDRRHGAASTKPEPLAFWYLHGR
jgi:hypothetical protein